MSAALVPCPSCARHVRAAETACPFCGASTVRARSPVLLIAAAVTATAIAAAAACKDDPVVVPPYGIPPIEDAGPDAGSRD